MEDLQLPAKGCKGGCSLVRDQEVGGSNPLAPTNLFSITYILSPPKKWSQQKRDLQPIKRPLTIPPFTTDSINCCVSNGLLRFRRLHVRIILPYLCPGQDQAVAGSPICLMATYCIEDKARLGVWHGPFASSLPRCPFLALFLHRKVTVSNPR